MTSHERRDAVWIIAFIATLVGSVALGVGLAARNLQAQSSVSSAAPPSYFKSTNRCFGGVYYVNCPAPDGWQIPLISVLAEAPPPSVTITRLLDIRHPTNGGSVVMVNLIETTKACIFVTMALGSEYIAQNVLSKKDMPGGTCQ